MKAKYSVFTVVLLTMALMFTAACNKPARTDAQLASDVQNKIFSDSNLQGKQIAVQANNGVVTLSGYVENDAQRTAASNDAGAIEGVKQVLNNLQVQAAQQQPTPTPEQTAENNAAVNTPAPAPSRGSAARTPAPSKNHGSRSSSGSNYSSGSSSNSSSAPSSSASNMGSSAPSQNMAPAPPPPPQKVTVPDGTAVSVRLVEGLDSEKNLVGDTFHATLNAPLIVNDQVVVPENADVEGRVSDVKSAGRFAGASQLTVELTKIRFNGHSYEVHTNTWTRQGSGRGKNTAAKVGGGAALGAIIGGIAGGGKGAAIGGAIGAGAGTGVQAATKGQQIKLGPEAVLNFQLQSPLTVMPASTLERGGNRQPMEP